MACTPKRQQKHSLTHVRTIASIQSFCDPPSHRPTNRPSLLPFIHSFPSIVHSVYLSGQVPNDFNLPLKEQVSTTLGKVDELLKEAGTDKSKLISAQLWLKDIGVRRGGH